MNVGLERVPQCMICGTEGPWLHRDLRDPRYGVRGRYHFRRCPRCSLVWLDPRPDPASIALCYQKYGSSLFQVGSLKSSLPLMR